MSRKLLNKNKSRFLKQAIPENLLSKSKKNKKTLWNLHGEGMPLAALAKADVISQTRENWFDSKAELSQTFLSNKSEKMQKVEAQILREFKTLNDKTRILNPEYLEEKKNKESGHINFFGNEKEQKRFAPSSSQKKLRLQLSKENVTQDNLYTLQSVEQIHNVLLLYRMERQKRSQLKDRLLESRKIRCLYGDLSYRQLEKSIHQAKKLAGNSSDNLLTILESRLDVVLERCAFFPSVKAARQSVLHRRIQINSRIVDMPGYLLKAGDVIQVQPLQNFAISSVFGTPDTSLRGDSPLTCTFKPLSTAHTNFTEMETRSFFHPKWDFLVSPLILNSLLRLEYFFFCIGFTKMQAYQNYTSAVMDADTRTITYPAAQDQEQGRSFQPFTCTQTQRKKMLNEILFLKAVAKNGELDKVLFSKTAFSNLFVPNVGEICNSGLEEKSFPSKERENIESQNSAKKTHFKIQNKSVSQKSGMMDQQIFDPPFKQKKLPLSSSVKQGDKGEIPDVYICAFDTKARNTLSSSNSNSSSKGLCMWPKQYALGRKHPLFSLLFQNFYEAPLYGALFARAQKISHARIQDASKPNQQKLIIKDDAPLFCITEKQEQSTERKNVLQAFFRNRGVISYDFFEKNNSTHPMLLNVASNLTPLNASDDASIESNFLNRWVYWLLCSRKETHKTSMEFLSFQGSKIGNEKNTTISTPHAPFNTSSTLDGAFYNTFLYWLELKKNLLSQKKSKQSSQKQNLASFKNQFCFLQKKTKPLHIEISYSSCTAIFLYAPQRVYLPALVDVELLVKGI